MNLIDIKDVIIVFLLLINRNIMYIAKDVNAIVKDTTIIVLGLLNVLEELIFSIFMECLLIVFIFFVYLIIGLLIIEPKK